MNNKKLNFKSDKELQEAVLLEKERGTPDLEIGQKYGVTYRYIEKLITKSQGINISNLNVYKNIKTLYPKNFKEERSTVWSFKQRGNWATHSGEYRGNWSPYIPRNVILKYSAPGELVLDYFCGAGTTAVECKLLSRKCIAIDINSKAIELARENLKFTIEPQQLTLNKENNHFDFYEPELLVADSRDLCFLKDNSIDLICAHPPYANILHYTNFKEGDLSFLDIDEFLQEMFIVAKESFRILKPGKKCAILIGDTRRKKCIVPLGFKFIDVYLNAGFKLKELVIKRQHNCKTTGFWYNNSIKYNFLLLAHEYLPIFEKPETTSSLNLKEEEIDYNLIIPILKKPSTKRKLDKLETRTVWVFPKKDFEKLLNKNVIERYSNGINYSTINFVSSGSDKIKITNSEIGNGNELLFIKSPFLDNKISRPYVEHYLNEIREIIKREISKINKERFIVIQTKDVRIDKYIEPLAKRLIDKLTLEDLRLKEIIIATIENENSNTEDLEEQLKITHEYLLVYEITNKDK